MMDVGKESQPFLSSSSVIVHKRRSSDYVPLVELPSGNEVKLDNGHPEL